MQTSEKWKYATTPRLYTITQNFLSLVTPNTKKISSCGNTPILELGAISTVWFCANDWHFFITEKLL